MNTLGNLRQKLCHLSHDLGRPEHRLVILGEGNTSCRVDSETLLVKASGSQLQDLEEHQLVQVRFEPILETLGQQLDDEQVSEVLENSRVDPEGPRPSVETLFHGWLLSQEGVNFVGHTHPTEVNKVLCSNQASLFAENRMFPDEIVCCGPKSLLVEYTDPGTDLGTLISREFELFVSREGLQPRIILIRNHGLIVIGATPGAVLASTLMAAKAAEVFVGACSAGGPTFMAPSDVARIHSRLDEHYRQRQLRLE